MKLTRIKQRLEKVKDRVNTSFWFVPMFCILIAFVILAITQQLDKSQFLRDWLFVSYIYSIDPIGARTVLSTIASAVITVTSIAFSMIVVSLTLASSQFGPRLLRTFMQDKNTQLALGVFVATFIYCLALIRFVSIDSESPFVPGIGLSVALLLTLISIFMLVFLIHHVATSIQADTVVHNCWCSLNQDVQRILPNTLGEEEHEDTELSWLAAPVEKKLCSETDGFIQLIDYDGLIESLTELNAGLTISVKPGDYVITGQCIAMLHLPEDYSDGRDAAINISKYMVYGASRTPIQDPEFSVNQLVEVALRALSPSVNDPFTAIACVNRIGSALNLFAQRSFPSRVLKDKNSTIRIQRKTADFAGVVGCACNQIRQASLSHPSVMIEFIEMLCRVL